MSKKRATVEGEDTRDPEAPNEGSPAPEPEHYTIGTWNGLTQYRCRHCPFDTLEGEGAIEAHYADRHGPPPPPPSPSRPPLVDRFGNRL